MRCAFLHSALHESMTSICSPQPRKSCFKGGKPTGGKPTGGKPTGGKPTGGKPTGGKPTGGKHTGGKPTGGKPTGGKPTGGKPTGGIFKAGKCEKSPSMLICCRAATMADSKVTVHFETLSTTMQWHRTASVIKIDIFYML